MKFNYPQGSTPLEPDELKALIPTHITTQEQLNAWEEKNILEAQRWGFKQKNILTIQFIKELHKRMFNHTWKWAGVFRQSGKNIGIDWHQISAELKKLCDDLSYWIEHQTYPIDEMAIRFHHRLVLIHPFPNGNGRHARLMADVLITKLGQSRFSWGIHQEQDLYKATSVRKQYIEALQCADRGDYSKLISFARS